MKKRNVWRNTLILVVLGVLIAVVGSWIADMSGEGYLLAVSNSLSLLCFALAFIIAVSALTSGNYRHGQPTTPDRSILTRVLENENTGEEMFLYGKHEDTPRSILKDDWPFDDELKDYKWIICDAHGNDVSDLPLTEFEGTVFIRFQE